MAKEEDWKAKLKAAGGAGIGALLGGLLGSKVPFVAERVGGKVGKLFGEAPSTLQKSAAGLGFGSGLGGLLGAGAASDDVRSSLGHGLGAVGGGMGGAGALMLGEKFLPPMTSKAKLLTALLGLSGGAALGAGISKPLTKNQEKEFKGQPIHEFARGYHVK